MTARGGGSPVEIMPLVDYVFPFDGRILSRRRACPVKSRILYYLYLNNFVFG